MGNDISFQSRYKLSLKRKLIVRYFPHIEDVEFEKVEIKLKYRDFVVLKHLFFPKSMYRTYYIQIRYNYEIETCEIEAKLRSEIKKILFIVNSV